MRRQPCFSITGTLDLVPPWPVTSYPTLSLSLSLSRSRVSRSPERSICYRLGPFIRTPHSGSLEIILLCSRSREAVSLVHRNARSAAVLSRTSVPLSLSLSLASLSSVSRSLLTVFIFILPFIFFIFFHWLFLIIRVQSHARLDTFVALG